MNLFIVLLVLFVLVTTVLFIISFSLIYFDQSFVYTRFCLDNQCIKNFEEAFEGPIKIIKNGMSFISWFSVVSGVVIALKTYVASVKAAALSGHVSHLTMFKNYLNDEMEKYELLNKQKIDIFKWYNLAFPDSSNGIIKESKEYFDFINKFSDTINETNNKINSPKGEFGYKEHQKRVMERLKLIGIDLSFLPKNNFHDTELEIFCLIDSVNQTFTKIELKLCDIDRSYT